MKREKTIDRKIKEMTEKIEKGKSDMNAEIAKMYNGKQYILFCVLSDFDDVRVVLCAAPGYWELWWRYR